MGELLVESAVRATVMVAVVSSVLYVARIKASSMLHAMWTGVVIAMLLLPVWSLWGVKASVEWLPSSPPAATTRVQPAPTALPVASSNVDRPVSRIDEALAPQRTVLSWRAIALAIYAVVACTLLVRLGLGTVRAHRLLRRSHMRGGQRTSNACASPVAVGWLRPVVILPDAWEQWPSSQLDAVLTHERSHVRHRDPLVQWFALLNRALFWFHPMAWWLERRLSALAEQRCDEAVLAQGHDPYDYSDYLLQSARAVGRGPRVNLAGVFMPGTFLAQRIRRILASPPVARVSYTRMASAVAACLVATVFSAVAEPVRALQSSGASSKMVARPVQPRWIPPESTAPQPVSLEWMDGDEWAFEVQSISTGDELREYGELRTAADREAFIARFWARRDPTPGTPENEFRDEFSRRVRFARERFATERDAGTPGFDTDRGRIYLMFGSPDAIETPSSENPHEVWHYRAFAELGSELSVRFLAGHGSYCAYRIVSPSPMATLEGVGTLATGEPVRHTLVQLYPLGLTAIFLPVDATRVVGAQWELRNRGGVQVDQGQIGWPDGGPTATPLAPHVPRNWFDGGVGCTHALPPGAYSLDTSVRFISGEIQRETVSFDVQ